MTHLFCVVKKAFAFSFISKVSSSFLPPRAGRLFVTLVKVAEVLPLCAVIDGVVYMSALGIFELTPPPTRYVTVRVVLFGVSPSVEYSSPNNGSIDEFKSLV